MQLGVRGRTAVLATALALVPASAAAAATPREIALEHLRDNAAALGVDRADLADLAVTSEIRSRHSGVIHVNVNQRHRGLEVFGGTATVNVSRNGDIIFVGDNFVRDLAASGSERLDAPAAADAAARELGLGRATDVRVLSQKTGPAKRTELSRGGVSEAAIPARLGYEPTAGGLRLAWQLTIDDTSDAHLWNATVDAATGELLAKDDWTAHHSADDLAHLSSAASAPGASAFGTPSPVIDGSSYRVFEFPNESNNDAPRKLIQNPADASASPFGWHDTNGAPGAEFTITSGNNVHAYLDQDRSNSPDLGDTNGGPGLDFDFEADLATHAQTHRDAAVTNLFYGNNMIHDVLWHYGFDEASGNFQVNNYGRGGAGGDVVRAEAADGNGTNNANFSTPARDGEPPRMQMFLWPGNQHGPQNQVVIDGGATFGANWSRFGPAPTDAGLPGRTLVAAGDGCADSSYPSPLPTGDWAVIVDSADAACDDFARVHRAAALGADAAIVAHTAEGNAPILSTATGAMSGPSPAIPSVSVTLADGAAIKADIADGGATGNVRKNPAHPGIRDGDLENGIVLHEYGHGVSNRLTGGIKESNCLSGNEQAGEGWSDFMSVTLLLDPALDDPAGPRGLVPWVLFQPNRQGNGLRPRPYSRTMDIQPFTYDSIKSNAWLNGTSLALPHGLGHGWNAVLWDMTWDLIDKHGFNPNIYGAWDTGGNNRSIQYVIDGLKMQGCGPGLVVARAAIIEGADELSDGEDTCTLWASFARRGLGFSAVQGTTDRNDNQEAFDTDPDCRRGFDAPVRRPYGELNEFEAGEAIPLRFTADGQTASDILTANSPFSRRVDCTTLQVPSQGEAVTPREFPINTLSQGGRGLTVTPGGRYSYNWRTLDEWAGTCREVVLTRDDGKQHRAYFRFE